MFLSNSRRIVLCTALFLLVPMWLCNAGQAISSELEAMVAERDAICVRGQQLHVEKNDALTTNPNLSTLAADYDKRMLGQIKNIIENYRRGRDSTIPQPEKDRFARSSLLNIVLSSGLLTKKVTNPYNPLGFQNGNFWENLRYLCKADLTQDPRHVSSFKMNNIQVQELMDSTAMGTFLRTCELEIASFDARALGHQDATTQQADAHRQTYRDRRHLDLATLYSFVAYQMEKESLTKSTELIGRVVSLPFWTPDLEHQIINKGALLRCLVITGEACTQKDLSPYTKQLYAHMIPADWQLLIKIRNKFAHLEWDFHSRNLEAYLNYNDGRVLLPALQHIQAVFGYIVSVLDGFSRVERESHYRGGVIAPPAAIAAPILPAGALTPLQALLAALPQTDTTMNADKGANPASFSIASIVQRIDSEEIPALNRIFNVAGQEALADPHPEEVDTLAGADRFLCALSELNNQRGTDRNSDLDEALQRIRNYHTSIASPLTVELPRDLFYHFLQRIGVGGAVALNLNQLDLIQNLSDRFPEYVAAVNKYGRHCILSSSLISEPQRMDAALHHFGRMGKFLDEIPVETILDPMTAAEYRAFRNYIQHGDDVVETYILKPHDFLIRYTYLLLHSVMPAVRHYYLAPVL